MLTSRNEALRAKTRSLHLSERNPASSIGLPRRDKFLLIFSAITIALILSISMATAQDDDNTRNILKQGLVGAGTGAIAAGTSGGNAGQGALIGAGTSVIGSALLDAMTTPSAPSGGTYRKRAAPPQDDYYQDQPQDEYYVEEAPPQESGSAKVLKQGLVGAGVGAISAGASGGNAGKGALIGAGTSVIGNALLDTITQPPAQTRGRVYRKVARPQPPPQPKVQTQTTTQEETTGTEGSRKKIIRKYDENGKVVSEEEIYY